MLNLRKLTEPEYDIYNLYPEFIDKKYCGNNCTDERNKFEKSLYYGRTSYVDITFDKNKISSTCDENCAFCLKEESSSCIICDFLYELLDNGRKKCLRKDEVPKLITQTDKMTISISEKEMKTIEEAKNEITDISNETILFTKETNIQTGKLIGSNDISASATELTKYETILTEIAIISTPTSSLATTEEINISREDTKISDEKSTIPTEIENEPTKEWILPDSTIQNKYNISL